MSVAACSEDGSVSQLPPAQLAVSPLEVQLGPVFVGQSALGEIRVSASSSGANVGWTSRFQSNAGGFVVNGASGSLAAGQVAVPEIRFESGFAGTYRTRLEVIPSNQQEESLIVVIEAEVRPIPDCEDGNGCTVDSFDLESGVCRHVAERLPCDDFDECTEEDFCVDGVCLGRSLDCNDNNVCTDDLCDRQQGCIHRLTVQCDDGNPCTIDSCNPVLGCATLDAEEGTPCEDGDPCTEVGICRSGTCESFDVPEGASCELDDPCIETPQCIEGICRDPDRPPLQPGDIKFATSVGVVPASSQQTTLVGSNGAAFVGADFGVVAVDECGAVTWTSTTAAQPAFQAATLGPGSVAVPIDGAVLELNPTTGEVLNRIELTEVLPDGAVEVVDSAVRASGALVVSLTQSASTGLSGYLVEVDTNRTVVTLFASLGPLVAERIALDRDESLVALLRDRDAQEERMVRFGIDGVPGGSWSTAPLSSQRSDLGLGPGGEVLWTAGLRRITTRGDLATWRSNQPGSVGGPPVVFGPFVWTMVETGLAAYLSTGELLFEVPLQNPALAAAPVVDAAGRVFVVDQNAVVHGFDASGNRLFETELQPAPQVPTEQMALSLSPQGILLVSAGRWVYGIEAYDGLAQSSWPKHRRDNLGTGHR